MVRRGAKHLLLLSRSGADKDNTLVADLISMGAAVVLTPRCDVSNKEELAATLNACKLMMPPIAGCFNAQMVLKVSVVFDVPHPERDSRVPYWAHISHLAP